MTKSNAEQYEKGQKVYSFENEVEVQIQARSVLEFQAPNRTSKALLGACYTPFEVHSVSLERSKPYWEGKKERILCPLCCSTSK